MENIRFFYNPPHPTAEIFRSLGQNYTQHPDFRANYDRYQTGFVDFLRKP
ncbi:MAG: TipAS antibiotic-recognition domain-containing protein [Chitinivibrionales bacterium]|nr:TipAS antibiotic-recognition domain-containing protein [Chitinivibrionales bacterium]